MRAPILFLVITASSCSLPQLELIPRFQQFDIDGEFAADSSGISGANDLADLGIDDDPIEFAPRLDFSAGPLDFTADYFSVDYSGTGDVEIPIEFNGQQFTLGAAVDSELSLELTRATVTWDLIPTDFIDVGLGFGGAFTRARATFSEPGGLVPPATTEEEAPFPYIAARARVALAGLSVELLAGYLQVEYDNIDASYLDLDLLARWAIIGGSEHLALSVLLGYRYVDLDLQYVDNGDNVQIDAELQGPYAGLSLTL